MRTAFLLLLLSTFACAGDGPRSVDATSDEGFSNPNPGPDLWVTREEVHGMATKLTRGLVDLGTCWLEFPKCIAASVKKEGKYPVLRVATGVFEGAEMVGARAMEGALEVGTFVTPYPSRYEPLLSPEYSFE